MSARTNNGFSEDESRGLPHPAGPWRRAVTLLVALAAFAAVNAFWRYLGTGRWVNFRPVAYYDDLTTPLADIFRQPLDVLNHPWLILVTGLLLGLVVLVPVIVAVLYRTLFSAAFVGVLALAGHAPVLALAVAIGCVLGGRSRLRDEMPFLASVLGLMPAAAYLTLSAVAGVDTAAVLPLQRWALYAPFLIGFITAVLAGAVVLGLMRLTGSRGSVFCVVLVALLAAPAAVFYHKIGPDEVDYAVIVSRLQTDGSIFEDEALDPWIRRNHAEGLNPKTARVRVSEDLRGRRDALASRCRAFLAKRPDSARKAAVRWLRAQVMSLQLDEAALAGGLIKYVPSFPLPESKEAWEELLQHDPTAPQAALADWRLGELALRAVATSAPKDYPQLVRQAEEHLHRSGEALAAMFPAAVDRHAAEAAGQVFSPAADVPGRQYYRAASESVERLVWLMGQNGVRIDSGKLVDANSAEALAACLDVNPKQADGYKRLVGLLSDARKKREATRMGDNLKLAVALQTPDTYERAAMLIELAKDERTDGAIVANFELGKLALRTAEAPAIALVKDLKTPEEYFKIVIAAPPNPYQQEAAELLAALATRSKAKP